MGFNKIILQGNLVEDISLRYSQSGKAIASSKIAVSKKFKKSDGSQGEKTLWLKFTMWGRLAEIGNQFLRKGSKVLLEGSLENEDYVSNDGVKKYGFNMQVENMQMLDTKDNNPESRSYNHDNQSQTPSYQEHPNVNERHYQGQTPGEADKAYQATQNPSATQPNNGAGQQSMTYQPQTSIPEYDIDDEEIPF